MSDKSTDNNAPRYDEYPIDLREIAKLFIVGLLVGAIGWLLYLAIAKFFIVPVFCESPATYAICRNGGSIAWISAQIVAGAIMVAVLAKFAVYRPLLVVLGVLASLWMAHSWLGSMSWPMALLWHSLLFGVAAAMFGWVARAKTFVLALLLSIVLVVLARALLVVS